MSLLTAFLAAFTRSARHPAFPFADDPEKLNRVDEIKKAFGIK